MSSRRSSRAVGDLDHGCPRRCPQGAHSAAHLRHKAGRVAKERRKGRTVGRREQAQIFGRPFLRSSGTTESGRKSPGLTARNELPTPRRPPVWSTLGRYIPWKFWIASTHVVLPALTPCPTPVLRSEGGCAQSSTDSSTGSSSRHHRRPRKAPRISCASQGESPWVSWRRRGKRISRTLTARPGDGLADPTTSTPRAAAQGRGREGGLPSSR